MPPALPDRPNFRSRDFLRDHALWILSFYDGRAVDPSGGQFHYFLDDGTVYDRESRHLVSATRFVVTGAMGFELGAQAKHRAQAEHALRFVRDAFFDPAREAYAWTLRWRDGRAQPLDRTRHMYGLAFVMLAAAHAARIGIDGARAMLDQTFAIAERQFFEADAGLYADDATPEGVVSTYRGQNANMHACEALIAAYDATRDARFIERAEQLAHGITVRLAAANDGDVWEHYTRGPDGEWTADWDYNRDDRSNIFRPWGYQPGHFTEWAKLLLQLDAHAPRDWHLPRARELFDRAWSASWDGEHGGLHYGFAPDGSICDGAKYHWVQAETMAAAALLAARTGPPPGRSEHRPPRSPRSLPPEGAVSGFGRPGAAGEPAPSGSQRSERGGSNDARYWHAYDAMWSYCWMHFVDHAQGAWFRILTRENFNLTREKSPAGKVDYHDIGACYDAWRAFAS
jgi:mannose/cellobiose epimerase-like protein (N-acyl-D-glucosamine 2-epimerase family)